MAVHHFPARADLLEASLVRASIWSSEWRAVLKGLDEMFPGGAATLRAADFSREPRGPSADVSREPRGPLAAGYGEARERGGALARPAPLPGRRLETMPAGAVFRIADLAETRPIVWGAVPDGREGAGAGLVVHRAGSRIWTLAVHLPEAGVPAFEASLVALLNRFAPAVRDSFLACFGLSGEGGEDAEALVRGCWDRAPFGVALITTALRPLVTNVIADDLFAVRRLFAPAGRSGRLRPASKSCDEKLERAVERILANPAARASVDIGRPWSHERLTIRLEALNRDPETAFLRGPAADAGDRLVATFHSPGRMAALAEVTGQAEGWSARPSRAGGQWPSERAAEAEAGATG